MSPKDFTCYIFIPGLSEKWNCGGLTVSLETAEFIAAHPQCQVQLVTTKEEHNNGLSLATAFKQAKEQAQRSFFLVTWGPDIEQEISEIRSQLPEARIIVYAQSHGYGRVVPEDVSLVCTSRYVMSQWALQAQANTLWLIPPILHPSFKFENLQREFDILVHKRKQNSYCLNSLVPALQNSGLKVKILDQWFKDSDSARKNFANHLNRSKVFLYATDLAQVGLRSVVQWGLKRIEKTGWRRFASLEGFGLPAMEALACGCLVASNLYGGVNDFLTPGDNCIKLQVGNPQLDVQRIKKSVQEFEVNTKQCENLYEYYNPDRVGKQWNRFLDEFLTMNFRAGSAND